MVLTSKHGDVVRHPLVQKIIERYEAAEHAPTDEKNTERSIFNEISVFDETSVLSDDFE